jgi:mannose-1-phosphate guanylyltransferase
MNRKQLTVSSGRPRVTNANPPQNHHSEQERSMPRDLWVVILAAGGAVRLAGANHLGERHRSGSRDVLAQVSSFEAGLTLLQQTVTRFRSVVPSDRIVVMVNRNRRELVDEQLGDEPGLHILSQPEDSGTGPGVLFPVAFIKAHAPNATVIVTPPDHQFARPEVLLAALERAMRAALSTPSGLVLIGAEPNAPALDHGWIVPEASEHSFEPFRDEACDLDLLSGRPADLAEAESSGATRVDTFVETLPAPIAAQVRREGGLWNTGIIVGGVAAFWSEGERHLPLQVALFEEYLSVFAAEIGDRGFPALAPARFLARLYRRMPPADFNRAVLECTRGLRVVAMRDSGWCDCGKSTALADHSSDRRQQVLRAILHSARPERTRPLRLAESVIVNGLSV